MRRAGASTATTLGLQRGQTSVSVSSCQATAAGTGISTLVRIMRRLAAAATKGASERSVALSSRALAQEESMTHRRTFFLALLVVATGCGSTQGHRHEGAEYCAEYRATMAGKSVEEQRRAAEAHVVQMHGRADPAHIERHMRMMEQRCGKPAG